MFDLFRKRRDHAVDTVAKTATPNAASAPEVMQRKQEALARAAALTDDEAVAVDFVMQCEFADARLQAAQLVHSRVGAEKILNAMRNVDRRVAKLMQARLDALARQEWVLRQAEQCISAAQALVSDLRLLPGQVSELDKAWEALSEVPDSAKGVFSAARIKLRDRLQDQAVLQRAVLDTLTDLRTLAAMEMPCFPDDAAVQLAAMERRMASHLAALEAPSLPRNLIGEFERAAAGLRQTLQVHAQYRQAYEERAQKLSAWEACEPASLNADALLREWQSLPATPDGAPMALLQERLDALLYRAADLRKARREAPKESTHDRKVQVAHVLERIEQALQEGALQSAIEHDKTLRALDLKAGALPNSQAARLSRARAELAHLQGWAKWGGHISREELVHAAATLPSQALAPAELAKKVGTLRDRWKFLDASAGPAGKDMWQRFDDACSTAYAPAAAHFKRLAEERQQNVVKAQGLIGEAGKLAAALGTGSDTVDWKSLASGIERVRQAWGRLGPMDRKEKKRLDAEFDAVLQPVMEPLSQARNAEAARREQLIAEAAKLDPRDRAAPETLRRLQERWQLQAKALPLERQDEQALWQRFREACGKAFAARKDAVQAADAERQAHLREKLAWCERLEAAENAEESEVRKLMRDAADAWDRIGAVPRSAEQQAQARYRKVVEKLRKRLDVLKRAKASAQWDAFRCKLDVCRTAEKSMASPDGLPQSALDQLAVDFGAIDATPAVLERELRVRFQAALEAVRSADHQYVQAAVRHRAALMHELLRMEIVAGTDSPPGLARERMQLQVDVLRSALKAGQQSLEQDKGMAGFSELVRLSAFADGEAQARIDALIAHCRKK